MKVSYSLATGRASQHCITWTHRKKRYRKYFRSRIDAVRFRNEKEQELGIRSSHEIENEIIFLALSEIKDRLDSMDQRIEDIEGRHELACWIWRRSQRPSRSFLIALQIGQRGQLPVQCLHPECRRQLHRYQSFVPLINNHCLGLFYC